MESMMALLKHLHAGAEEYLR